MADDYTVEDYRAAARRAYEAGNIQAAEELAQAGIALQQRLQEGQPEVVRDPNGQPVVMRPPRADAPQGAPTERQTDAERLVGDIRATAGRAAPVLEDINRSAASGLAQGTEGLASIPSLPGRAMDAALGAGARVLMGDNAPEWTQRPQEFNRQNPPPASALMRSTEMGNEVLSYSPETTAGEYVQTTARYVPGALLFGGGGARAAGGNTSRYAVAPGVAEETAGQATEGTALEPYARTAAGITAGTLAARQSGQVRPFPRARETDARAAETLREAGVRPTVGQVTRSEALRRMEGATGQVPDQLEQFTRAAMRTIGSEADEASPAALKQAKDAIIREMDSAVAGVTFTPDAGFAQQARQVALQYQRATARSDVIPDVRNIVREIGEAAQQSNPIPLSQLRDWRSRLGELLGSGKSQTVAAAARLRSLIDDATTAELTAAGRSNDVARLARSREQFRNWLAIADAATRPGASGGLLSPEQVRAAVRRSQDWRQLAIGNTTDLGRLTEAADAVIRPAPTVRAGGERTVPPEYGTSALGAAAGYQMGEMNGATAIRTTDARKIVAMTA